MLGVAKLFTSGHSKGSPTEPPKLPLATGMTSGEEVPLSITCKISADLLFPAMVSQQNTRH